MQGKANVAMDNITDNGKTVIRNLAKEAVKVVDGAHTYVTSKVDGNATAYAVNIKTGQVASGDGGLVTGGAVYDAIQGIKASGGSGQPVDISGKADISAGNVGQNFTKFSDTATTDELQKNEKIANENAWGNALGTGRIANSDATVKDADKNGSKQLVTGNTVYKEVRPASDGTYIKTANTTAQNLKSLDTAIQNQATDLKVNQGWGIAIANETDPATKATKKNVISLSRNLGKDYDTSDDVNLKNDTAGTSLILGGRVEKGSPTGGQLITGDYGALGKDSVTVGGVDNTVETTGDAAVVVGGIYNKAVGQKSAVVGGSANDAVGNESSVFGGNDNDAYGTYATLSGGSWNKAYGNASSIFGGSVNDVSGNSSVAVGGYGSHVYGDVSVGIAGGSTNADYALAAGNEATVTVDNGTAIGYQATANKAGTVAFGHDKDDVYYTSTWLQKATEKDGKYYDANNKEITKDQYEALRNADLTFNDYSKKPTVTENKYTSAAYNRLVKVADGIDDHDVVVMEQLKQYAEKDASNIGNNIKVYMTDENGNVQLGDDKKPIEDKDATTTAQNGSKDDWGEALGVGTLASSTAASNSDQLITGKTLYNYDKPVADDGKTLSIVSADKTTGQNLSALDTQVKANTDALTKPNHNIKYYAVDETTLPKLTNFNGKDYSNEKNDGAKGMGSMAAGFNTHADGILSTVAGSYSGVVGTGFQGATALSYGTFNVNQNTDTSKWVSGVANSIIGQANVTENSNAAIIYGAGNTVTNSYRDITVPSESEVDLGKVKADIKKNDMAAVIKDLQTAVPQSGGQVMVMGGGNSVDKAYMTQVTGVGNTVQGSGTEYGADSTQLNYIEGFYTKLKNGKNDYIIGSHNTVTGTSTETNQSNIVFGDNHTLTNTKNNVILGSLDAVDETTVSDVVSIGHNAKVTKEGGVAIGSGSEATTAAGVAGYDPTGATADTTAAWTSKKAAVSVGTADETRQITGVAAGKEETDAVNVAQLKKLNGMKANVDASNIGKNLTGTEDQKKANAEAWASAIGNGIVASDSNQLVTGKTVYNEVRPSKDGTYVKMANTTAANLTALDTQVGTNTNDITNLKDLKNITDNGKTVIKNLAKDTVKVEQGDRVTVTHTTDEKTGAITYKVSANNNGTVTKGDTNLVSGDTVNTAITNAINQAGTDTDTKLKGKADIDAGNIGANLNYKADGTAVTKDDKTANEKAWATAIGTGDIAKPADMLVTDTAVHNEVRPTKDGTYVKAANTTAANLTALDTQVGTNTNDITNLKDLKNITDNGKTVIKNLAKGSIGMEDGSHTTVSHRDVNGVETYKVDVKVDGEVKSGNKGIVDGGTVYNAIQDVKNQTNADLANKANVDASNLSSDNVKSWQEKLGNGQVRADNKGLVTGDTVFQAVDTKANRDGSNLTADEAGKFSEKIAVGKVESGDKHAVSGDAVSQAISKVTGNMHTQLEGKANTSLNNITKDGETVIKKLSQDAVQVEAGDRITVKEATNKETGNKTYTISANNNGTVAKDDGNLISGDTLYNEVHVEKDGSYIKSGNTVGQNLSSLDTGLKTTSDLIHTNTAGDTIQIGGNSTATKIDVSGKDGKGNTTGRVITGVVSDASDPNSAANVGYVNGLTAANTQQIYRDMNNAYGNLNRNINRAAAGSNALAALHPLDYDPADKASFAVGYGHYRNANAAAIGAFYYPNANTMVNVGVSVGNGDPGINAGVSFKLGQGSAYNGVSKAEMAQTIHDQAEEIKTIKANDATKDKRIDALEKENQEMKKQIQEILARLNG